MHYYELSLFLAAVLQPSLAFSSLTGKDPLGLRASLAHLWPRYNAAYKDLATNPNGSTFLWLPQDEYSGKTFFDGFTFFPFDDPTHGTVTYVNETYAFQNGLAYVNDDGTVVMKGDNTTWLPEGQNRSSVRISSIAQYNTGLFILDLNRAPWGCGVWPAFWTVGGGQWPFTGEIDILEVEFQVHSFPLHADTVQGVHDNEHNQVTWHTGPGCSLTLESNYTGSVVSSNGVPNTNCDGNANGNAGCGITEWSKASYGPFFEAQGGGVFAMKWDETGIAVYSFYRSAIPGDITSGSPNPATWGTPVAALAPAACDPLTYFVNHSIIFDITFCGDWAGNSYATSGCPGSCTTRLMDPSNFVNASWSINSLKVYRKQTINGRVSAAAQLRIRQQWLYTLASFVISLAFM
ncbi:glycoside hydrolase family 16 protein [Mycena latifolia]|nr:glycoside hydrolase family 16 protein [Mycena latifolia]